mmetsp:Transcript_19810/g.27501  ORF Transcript_19810/g.27501 Transcript_19810/m.27501 type:complete len:518 (+) Transcript_19810:158-1711(+)
MMESLPVKENRNLGGKKGSTGKKKGGKKGGKGKKDTDLGLGDNYLDPDPHDNHYGSGKKGGKGGKGYTGSTPPATPDGNDGVHQPSVTPGNTNDGETDANGSDGSSNGSNETGGSSNGTGGSSNGTDGSSNETGGSSNGTDGPSGEIGGFSIISSPAPTNPPTPQTTSGGDGLTDSPLTVQECQAISDGLGPITGTAMNFRVETDVIHTPDANVTTVLAAFNENLQQVVAPQMAGCDSNDAAEVRKLLVLEGSIKNVLFGFTIVNKNRRCETLFSPPNECVATDTRVAVYVSKDGNRRVLNEAFVGADLSSTTSVSEINHARALAEVNSEDVGNDIAKYVYNANANGDFNSEGFVLANVTGTTLVSVTDTTQQEPKVANVAQEVQANDDGGMKLRGILPLAVGLVALVLLLMCVVKRRRNTTDTSQHVYLDDDEDWKSEDNTAEEHSLENGDDTEVNYELNVGGMDTVDVHRCNSAMCDICNQRKKLEFLRVERSFASGLTDDAMKEYFDGGDLVAL